MVGCATARRTTSSDCVISASVDCSVRTARLCKLDRAVHARKTLARPRAWRAARPSLFRRCRPANPIVWAGGLTSAASGALCSDGIQRAKLRALWTSAQVEARAVRSALARHRARLAGRNASCRDACAWSSGEPGRWTPSTERTIIGKWRADCRPFLYVHGDVELP